MRLGKFMRRPWNATARLSRRSYSSVAHHARPLQLCIIGSGPSGFYTASRVLSKIPKVAVQMYEQLPTPFGLVRYGVAPDHPEVKNCQDRFAEVAADPRFTFIGNVAIGDGPKHLPLKAIFDNYDAVCFAYGASRDKILGIPGEDRLKGIYSARTFVGWYNGLPEYSDLQPNLDGEEAVIIGQGNVALDVARILLKGVDHLKASDITDQALETLKTSRIKRVRVLGRRGPLQGAFTIKEVRELLNLPSVAFHTISEEYFPPTAELPRATRRILDLLKKGSSTVYSEAGKSWSLDFCCSPQAFNAAHDSPKHLGSISVERTSVDCADPNAAAQGTGDILEFPASVAFRSIGYKSQALPGFAELGVPFNGRRGIIPNIQGRVVHPKEDEVEGTDPLPGLYCTGWVQRGPTGVIATTMSEAFNTADSIIYDWESHEPFLHASAPRLTAGWDTVEQLSLANGVRPVSWHDWQRIDELEQERGRHNGKPREKFTNVEEMLAKL